METRLLRLAFFELVISTVQMANNLDYIVNYVRIGV